MVVGPAVSGLGLIVLSVAFVRLAASDRTEKVYILVAEYGLAVVFLLAGVALIGYALTQVMG